MTYQTDCTLPELMLEQIAAQGLDYLPEMMRIIINAAMQAERETYLNAQRYERTDERRGYANGYKPKTRQTRVGAVTFDVPQVRDGGFYPSALEKGLRSERAFRLTLAEMYVQGVSTRKVAAITQKLCGVEVTSTQVSRATLELDEQLTAWRERKLGRTKYMWVDARYEKVRDGGQIRDMAVLIAVGLNENGRREVLGVSVSLSEAEIHWRTFFSSLVKRGLCGVELVISDAHEGLKAARRAVFGGVKWQRCHFHLQQNAQAYIPKRDMKENVAAEIRAILTAPSGQQARSLLDDFILTHADSAPRLATWAETALPEGFTIFDFPAKHRVRLRTTNGMERLNRELKRRSRVVGIFPNEAACLRLASAILMEVSDDWIAGRTYLSLKPQDE